MMRFEARVAILAKFKALGIFRGEVSYMHTYSPVRVNPV